MVLVETRSQQQYGGAWPTDIFWLQIMHIVWIQLIREFIKTYGSRKQV